MKGGHDKCSSDHNKDIFLTHYYQNFQIVTYLFRFYFI